MNGWEFLGWAGVVAVAIVTLAVAVAIGVMVVRAALAAEVRGGKR